MLTRLDNAMMRPSILVIASALVASASANDCNQNNEPYTGYSLKSGSGCTEYVNCVSGNVAEILSCPNGTLYDGNIGVAGVCAWADSVECMEISDATNNEASEDFASELASKLKITIQMEKNYDHGVDCSLGDWGLCYTKTLIIDYVGQADYNET